MNYNYNYASEFVNDASADKLGIVGNQIYLFISSTLSLIKLCNTSIHQYNITPLHLPTNYNQFIITRDKFGNKFDEPKSVWYFYQ